MITQVVGLCVLSHSSLGPCGLGEGLGGPRQSVALAAGLYIKGSRHQSLGEEDAKRRRTCFERCALRFDEPTGVLYCVRTIIHCLTIRAQLCRYSSTPFGKNVPGS